MKQYVAPAQESAQQTLFETGMSVPGGKRTSGHIQRPPTGWHAHVHVGMIVSANRSHAHASVGMPPDA